MVERRQCWRENCGREETVMERRGSREEPVTGRRAWWK